MKTKTITNLLTLLMAALLGLAISGCEKGSLLNADLQSNGAWDSPAAFDKKKDKNPIPADPVSWPIVASSTFRYNPGHNAYMGGNFKFGNGNRSVFTLEDSALTPPPGTPPGEDIVITMIMDYDSLTNELDITFSPHGCVFAPRAMVKIDYAPLNIELPILYYIDDNGNRIPQQPDQIKKNKKWLFIRLDHFSRYALAQA